MDTTALLAAIDKLSDKLGVATEKLYDVMLKQVHLSLYTEALGPFIATAVFVGSCVAARTMFKKARAKGYNETYDILSIIFTVTSIFVSIPALVSVVTYYKLVVTVLNNPEYAALTSLFQLLRN